MRRTPHALITIGIALALYALWSLGAAAMADGMQAAERHAARLLIKNLSTEDIRRVLELPSEVQVTGDSLEHSIGLGRSAWVARYVSANIALLGILGVSMVAWGALESANRKPASTS